MKKKFFLKTISIAMLSFLCVFWSLCGGNIVNATWSEMTCLFLVTLWILPKNEYKIKNWQSILALIIGSIILPMMVILCFWQDEGQSKNIVFPISMIIAILLAWLCHNQKKWIYYFISLILAVVYNTWIVDIIYHSIK